MVGRFLQFIKLYPPVEKPPHEQRFRVIRRSGSDYYAIGVLPQFQSTDKTRAPYHVLSCKKVRPIDAAFCRELSEDRQLVTEILAVEKNPTYRAVWDACLFGGRFTSNVDSGTHFVQFEYFTRPGYSRFLVCWVFDFGVSEAHSSHEIALAVCDHWVNFGIPDLKGKDLLIPSKNARRYWHTMIERVVLHATGVLQVN